MNEYIVKLHAMSSKYKALGDKRLTICLFKKKKKKNNCIKPIIYVQASKSKHRISKISK